MKTEFKSLSSGERLKINNDLNGISSVKAGKGLINWLINLVDIISDERKPSWTRSSVVFVRSYWRLRQSMGPKGTVKYLKACYVLLMQATGGMKIKSSQSLGIAVSRSADGLPRIIPRLQRSLIRSGNRKAIRIWMSWFSLYRVIEYPSMASLSTITDPGKVLRSKLLEEVPSVMEAANNLWNNNNTFRESILMPNVKMLYKSSPTVSDLDYKRQRVWKYSGSLYGLEQGAVSLIASPVWDAFKAVHKGFASIVTDTGSYEGYANKLVQCIQWIATDSEFKPSFVGRLGFKQEAAGKVRVFAMVDAWTQFLLGPLHTSLFKLLKTFPTDGTFDQMAPIRRLQAMGLTRYWCFDLSAATDRLPVSLQATLLDTLLGNSLGQHWKTLLVGREYQVPDSELIRKRDKVPSVKYSVGQPMGALSSWAMLALTHHLLVLWAAKRAGLTPGTFTKYAVLGDDIVIADGRVAQQYLILLEELGVKVGLAKSLVSRKGALEFAKRYFVNGIDCSPVALKEVAAVKVNPTFAGAFGTKYQLSFARVVSILGFGYRVKARLSGYLGDLPQRIRSYLVSWFSPWGPCPLPIASWINLEGLPRLDKLSEALIREDWLEWLREKVSLTPIPKFMEEVAGNLAMFTSPPHGPHAVKHNNVLLLSDLKLPKKGPWSKYDVNHRGLRGIPDRHLIVLGVLQSAVSAEMIEQTKETKEIKSLFASIVTGELSFEELIINFFEARKKIRLLRSPTQIAHCETKSNKVGLAYIVKVWKELQELTEEQPSEEKVVEHDSTEDHSSDGTISSNIKPL